MTRGAKGVRHCYTTEQLLAFAQVPTKDKLRWLGDMRRLLERFQSPEARATMERFRKGEL